MAGMGGVLTQNAYKERFEESPLRPQPDKPVEFPFQRGKEKLGSLKLNHSKALYTHEVRTTLSQHPYQCTPLPCLFVLLYSAHSGCSGYCLLLTVGNLNTAFFPWLQYLQLNYDTTRASPSQMET